MSKIIAIVIAVGGCVIAGAAIMTINAYNLNDAITQAKYIPIIPNPAFTPGDINPAATKEVVCVKGYTESEGVRHVTEATKKQVFKEYGLTGKEQHFEIDHLWSLENGGSNDIKNLWPQSYDTKPWNAHVKDKLENKLHQLICNGTITIQQAGDILVHDWIKGYCRYYTDMKNDCEIYLKLN